MKYHLRINGQPHDVDVDPEMPLLWVLRDIVGLTGTRFGCGEALCGACVVHVDGEARRSCVLPVRRVADHEVMTIEGLSPDGDHPLQQAWVDLGVPQCGYCQAGQIMSAAALLRQVPSPTDEQIDQSLAGNICRCGTYVRIRSAVKKAAQTAAAQTAAAQTAAGQTAGQAASSPDGPGSTTKEPQRAR